MITVEKTNTDVRVTIPKNAVPPEQLDAFPDWLRLEEVAQRSRLTEQQADKIANETKTEWWAANKERFIPPNDRLSHVITIRCKRHDHFDHQQSAGKSRRAARKGEKGR